MIQRLKECLGDDGGGGDGAEAGEEQEGGGDEAGCGYEEEEELRYKLLGSGGPVDVVARDAHHNAPKQDLEDLEYSREGFEVSHIDKEGRGGGGGDHPVYGDLRGHPAACGGGDASACHGGRKWHRAGDVWHARC